MNIFKRAVNAVAGLLKKKKINLNKINDVTPIGNKSNASYHPGRSSFATCATTRRQRNKIEQHEIDRNRWKTGGTGSWAKAYKRFGSSPMYGNAASRRPKTLTPLEEELNDA